MNVKVISFHVFDTPMDMLERLAIGMDQGLALAEQLKQADESLEMVPVCTCNRLEFYFESDAPEWCSLQIYQHLSDRLEVPVDGLRRQAREYEGQEAVRHLFQSIAGLKSIALGENQIQGQIRQAYLAAREKKLVGRRLAPLFETAIRVGKRVRNEIRIGGGRFSLSKMALKQILPELESVPHPQVLIVGTGKMARAAADYLRSQPGFDFAFVSQHPEQRADLARQFGKPVLHFRDLPRLLGDVDVLFSAYGTHRLLISKQQLAEYMAGRTKPLFVIDIAMPRDVDPAVAELEGVRFIDFDTLYHSQWRRELAADSEIQRAQEIIEDELLQFRIQQKQRELSKTIHRLHAYFGEIARGELDRTLRSLSHLPQQDLKKIEKLAHSITQKILHRPTVILREHVDQDQLPAYLRFVEEMINLKTRNPVQSVEKVNLEPR